MFVLGAKEQSNLKNIVSQNYRLDEKQCVINILNDLDFKLNDKVTLDLARSLITKVRNLRIKSKGIDILMQQFKLSSNEGIALMCLAESLLRIPDKITQDQLIKDKIIKGKWAEHIHTEHFFVNAASWGLLLTGKLIQPLDNNKLSSVLVKLIAKGSEPLIRKAMSFAIRLMGNQFVMSETIEGAIQKASIKEKRGYSFSFDMLGEAAITKEDASYYMQSYISAIHAVGFANKSKGVYKGSGISVKLSALHPRYQRAKLDRVMQELYPKLKELFLLAMQYQIGLYIDAEEADRLELSLDLFEKLALDKDLQDFNGIGFVVQGYQKRALSVIDYLVDLAKKSQRRFMIRLVKGAYWDSEIKKAQIDGQIDYPVFTRKFYTDISYIACAKKILEFPKQIYPSFATHNAMTLATIYNMAQDKEFEFQGLYGMGEDLYDNIVGIDNLGINCRIYAPVGSYETLLSYLVRRLLENGANSSFVNQLVDKNTSIDDLLVDPLLLAKKTMGEPNPYFSKPAFIYPDNRINSKGFDLTNELTLYNCQVQLNQYLKKTYIAQPLIANYISNHNKIIQVVNPSNQDDKIGEVMLSSLSEVDIAVGNALEGFNIWSILEAKVRADILFKMADLLEDNYFELLNLLVREAGKTLSNAIGEVREAIDFCRYYATQVRVEFSNISHKPLGIIVCISPWNFPLAIFMGEICSALVVGNSVIAKPAAQTNLIAYFAINLFYKAGMPKNVLQLLPGSGSIIGNALTQHLKIKGVIFTGSTAVARLINHNLLKKPFPSVLIAETGGQNCMVVDSSALIEQVVTDVITSGFDSAGQRCSALRVLYLQNDIADKFINMLKGAMNELLIGDPMILATDIGPVIDKNAQKGLLEHIEKLKIEAKLFYQLELPLSCSKGFFVAPTIIEIDSINQLSDEVFGPVIHIIRFTNDNLNKVIEEINSTGYGLTQGLHSRIEGKALKIAKMINAGNIYINRNMVGAVVGVQPFGGEGLSGTGPKAGGPFYLYRLIDTLKQPKLNFIEESFDFSKLERFLKHIKLCVDNNEEELFLLDYADKQRSKSLLNKKLELVGPTGEDNFIIFAKRGKVACFADDKLNLIKQIICALATDNEVVLPDSHLAKLLIDLEPKIFTRLMPNMSINIALITTRHSEKMNFEEICKNYNNGPLILQIIEKDGTYNLNLLMTERTISNNITVTGGNTQLMSIIDTVTLDS